MRCTHARYKTGEDEYQSLPEFNDLPYDQYASATSSDPSMCAHRRAGTCHATFPDTQLRPLLRAVRYMNHSCDPTCWFEGSYLMTATRDIAVGDEVRRVQRKAVPLLCAPATQVR